MPHGVKRLIRRGIEDGRGAAQVVHPLAQPPPLILRLLRLHGLEPRHRQDDDAEQRQQDFVGFLQGDSSIAREQSAFRG